MTDKKYVSAKDGEKNSVLYKTADGSEFLHSGGSRAWRNNNPGNLSSAEKSGLMIGKGGKFAVFSDHDTGIKALKYSLTHFYSDLQLNEVFKKYAPSTDNNNPEHYIELVKKFTGLDSSRTLGDVNDAELAKFMAAIERVEGWIVGKVEEIPHAQQFEVKAVDGKPLGGLDYMMSFFTKSGEEKKVAGKTDEEGKTAVAKTDTRSTVTLTLPRPDPGQSLKDAGIKAKASPVKKVVAAEVNAKPWYEHVFSNADESVDKKDAAPASPAAVAQKEKPKAPLATVKQSGAIKASATQNKADNFVAPVVITEGVFVTWEFDTSQGSGKNLNALPYFVALLSGDTPGPLIPNQRVQLLNNGKIRQKVPFGKEVALCLGNDAKSQYRSKPLYRITAEEGLTEIVVKIKEKRGTTYDASKELPYGEAITGTKKTLQANMYGTTWLNFSHKFTEAEADDCSKNAGQAVRDAMKQIYRGDPTVSGDTIRLSVVKPNGHAMKISWGSSAFDNCRRNIPSVNTLALAKSELIPRVSPHTYQAFLLASFEMDIEELEISSGWRPMLGSVLHRIGVGLDVVRIKVNGSDKLFNRGYTSAENEYRHLRVEKGILQKKATRTAEETRRLNEIKAIETAKASAATQAIHNDEHDYLRTFTTKLRACGEVRQTFDPWEMETNTADALAPTPNRLAPGNEDLHKTHLHITVYDAELGHGK